MTTPPLPEAPEGWKLVPEQSSMEMDKIAAEAIPELSRTMAEECWRVMIAAAPAALSHPALTAWLFEHDDGRYSVHVGAGSPEFSRNDPAWHRVGPVDVSALSHPAPVEPREREPVRLLRSVWDVTQAEQDAMGDDQWSAWKAELRAADQGALPVSELLTSVEEMRADACEVYNLPETSQDVRDAIEYCASWMSVYLDKRIAALASASPTPAVPQPTAQAPAAPALSEPDKFWCETCEGTGSVYQEHQAGCHVGGDFPCPDCDGNGYWTRHTPPAAPAAPAAQGLTTCNCRWQGDDAIQQCTLHAAWKDTLHEYAEELRALRPLATSSAPPALSEPVAEVSAETFSDDGTSDIIKPNLPIGTKLYDHPAPAAQGLSKPVAYRAWFDADNGARWLFTLWPEEERLDVTWEPLYTAPPSDSAVIPTHSEQGDLHDSDVKAAQGLSDAANMFWNDADPERGHDSIFEVLDAEFGDGVLSIGDTRVIQCAIRLPNITVQVVADPEDEDSFDYEVLAASRTTPKDGA